MNNSIIEALLAEEKDRCLYIPYTGTDSSSREGAFINCIDAEESILAQDITTEQIVEISKDGINSYGYEHQDSTYESLLHQSSKYSQILNKFNYLKFYKELFNSSKIIAATDFHVLDLNILNLNCLKISLDIEEEDIDTYQHPNISKALEIYKQEYKDMYFFDSLEPSLDLLTSPETLHALEHNEVHALQEIALKLNDRLREEFNYIIERRTDENYIFIIKSFNNLKRATALLRDVVGRLNNDYYPTPRTLLSRVPHMSPIRLFDYSNYNFHLNTEEIVF